MPVCMWLGRNYHKFFSLLVVFLIRRNRQHWGTIEWMTAMYKHVSWTPSLGVALCFGEVQNGIVVRLRSAYLIYASDGVTKVSSMSTNCTSRAHVPRRKNGRNERRPLHSHGWRKYASSFSKLLVEGAPSSQQRSPSRTLHKYSKRPRERDLFTYMT